MAIHKLDLGEFDKVDYNLIAIHFHRRLQISVFHQSKLPINLSKSNEEVQIKIKGGETTFSRFDYYDSENGIGI
jgi:hypothetical protein